MQYLNKSFTVPGLRAEDWERIFGGKKLRYPIGTILCVCDLYDPISAVIRLITKSSVNHIALVISETEIIEALANGVVISPIDRYTSSRFQVYPKRLKLATQEDILEIIKYCKAQVGKKYDWLLLIWLALKGYLKNITYKGRVFDVPWRYICSELISKGCASVKQYFRLDKDPAYITPQDTFTSTIVEDL